MEIPFYIRQEVFCLLQKGIGTAGLSELIRKGHFPDYIRECEEDMRRRLSAVTEKLVGAGAQVILVTGPSASGKTTVSHRIARDLEKLGLPPVRLSLDDYYLERSRIPMGPDGKRDFEIVDALDIPRFLADLESLLSGRETLTPVFDFKKGGRSDAGRLLRRGPGCAVLAEGIHAFSKKLELAGARAYRVYAEAVPGGEYEEPSDARLARRLVRDERCRAADWRVTFDMWPGVRRGEMQNLFPDKHRADEFVNTFLPYEPCVLRRSVERVLGDSDAPEAIRLRREFAGYECADHMPPPDSVLSEFVGGSLFGE